jgi:outer membrane usher protein
MNGDPVPRQQLNANGGLSLRTFGSVGVAYAGIDGEISANPVDLSITSTQRAHILCQLFGPGPSHVDLCHRVSRSANQGSGGLQVGLTIPFGRNSSVGVSGASDGSGQVQVQRPAQRIGDWGYQAYVSAGDTQHEFVQGQYKSHLGLFTGGVDLNGGETTLRLESQGALSLVDGGLFPSNTIYDSFAIVDTGPMAHVHVLQENCDVGRTNSAGRLLVPDMRSFDLNHLAIEPTDVPPDATIDVTTREVRPQDRSGSHQVSGENQPRRTIGAGR